MVVVGGCNYDYRDEGRERRERQHRSGDPGLGHVPEQNLGILPPGRLLQETVRD